MCAETQPTQQEAMPNAGERYVTMTASSLHSPAADQTTLLVSFTIEKDWHLYWTGYNDSGLPPRFTFTADVPGVVFGEPSWPAPIRHVSEGDIVDHIYENKLTLAVPVTIPASLSDQRSLILSVKCKYLVCKDSCLPGVANSVVTIPLGKPTKVSPGTELTLAAHIHSLPLPIERASEKLNLRYQDGVLNVSAKDGAPVRSLRFFPGDGCTPSDLINQGEAVSDSTSSPVLKIEVGPNPQDNRLHGIVEVCARGAGENDKPIVTTYLINLPASPVSIEKVQSGVLPKDAGCRLEAPIKNK